MLKLFKNKKQTLISPSIVVFTTFFLLFLYLLFSIRTILVWIFLGFILMVALHPFVQKLERWGLPRGISIALTYLLMFLSFGAVVAVIVPPLATQLYEFVKNFQLPWLQEEIKNFSLSLQNLGEVGNVAKQLQGSVNAVYSIISSTFTGVFTIITVLVISLYLMIDRKRLYLRATWFTNKKKELNSVKDLIDSLEHQLGGWVRGQLILMIVIGVVTYLGVILLGLPYAVPLGLLAALLEILPNLGPTLAAIPAIILAFVTLGPVMALVTALFYNLMQQFENSFVVPKVMKENVDVSPLASIINILVGLKLGGVIGALLAIPVYIVLRTVYSMWLKDLLVE